MRGILTYHSIDGSRSPISVDEAAFSKHCRWLASGAVKVVSLDELIKLPDDEDAVAITFDDAFVNLADVAWPMLRDAGLPATVYVPTGRVGRDNSWGDQVQRGIPTIKLCDWDTLGRLAEEGLEIGSHTVNHVRLDGLDEHLVRAELTLSAEALETRLGTRPRLFCYPYGGWDTEAARLAGEVYDLSVTTDLRVLVEADAYHRLPRLDAYYYRDNDLLEAWGQKPFLRHLWVRGQARKVRAALGG